MNSTTSWLTVTLPRFNHSADLTYGSICILCFVIGTSGNIVSFLYFRLKRKDISSIIYRMIIVVDVVVSVEVLPVGISLWSGRKPGLIFGNKFSCVAWVYVWNLAHASSIFLVVCLSIARTYSILRPFVKQKVNYLIMAVSVYVILTVSIIIRAHTYKDIIEIKFNRGNIRCDFRLQSKPSNLLLTLEVSRNVACIAPAFVVAASCVVTSVLLTTRNSCGRQRDIRKTRNKATVTVLLFALVYAVCNLPLVVDRILLTYELHTDNIDKYFKLNDFDPQMYYQNAIITLLLAINSAANPVLYFWRMDRLRKFTLAGTRRTRRFVLREKRKLLRLGSKENIELEPLPISKLSPGMARVTSMMRLSRSVFL